MDVLVSLAGGVLIAAALHEVFRTLFHPRGRGVLTAVLQHSVWRLARRVGRRMPGALTLAGPVIVVAVIVSWLTLVVAGWTLVYWPWLPEGVLLAEGLAPGEQGGLLDALYLSLVTVATLGFGDIAPQADWLRVVAPVQALVGFGLVTAAISWLLSIYPALSQIRGLAADLSALEEAAADPAAPGVEDMSSSSRAALLHEVETRLSAARDHLSQFPVVHYFAPGDRRYSLAETLPVVVALVAGGRDAEEPDVRLNAARLAVGLDRLAETLGGRFLGMPEGRTQDVLAAYRRERRSRGT